MKLVQVDTQQVEQFLNNFPRYHDNQFLCVTKSNHCFVSTLEKTDADWSDRSLSPNTIDGKHVIYYQDYRCVKGVDTLAELYVISFYDDEETI